jgi:hypothetical protein
MKKTTPLKSTAPKAILEASGSFANINMPFKQAAAFETLMTATGYDEFTAAARVISIGLFTLGLDAAGDYCLKEMTDALLGKDSDDSVLVHNSIVDAGSNAHDARINAEREQRGSVTSSAEVNA